MSTDSSIKPLESRINEQDTILNAIRDAVRRSNPNRPLPEVVAELVQRNEALQHEMLTTEVFLRVAEWLRDPARKRAANAFTASMERQIAYLLETDVLPVVKSLEIRLANAEKRTNEAEAEVDRLLKGEFICRKCCLRKDGEHPAGNF